MPKLETAPNGMTKVVDVGNGDEVFFYLEDLLYVVFDQQPGDETHCQIGIRGTDYFIKALAKDGRALLNEKSKKFVMV